MRTFEPYDKLKQPLPDMRDHTVKLVKQAIGEQRRAYVLTNNRTEGNAPETTKALYTSHTVGGWVREGDCPEE